MCSCVGFRLNEKACVLSNTDFVFSHLQFFYRFLNTAISLMLRAKKFLRHLQFESTLRTFVSPERHRMRRRIFGNFIYSHVNPYHLAPALRTELIVRLSRFLNNFTIRHQSPPFRQLRNLSSIQNIYQNIKLVNKKPSQSGGLAC